MLSATLRNTRPLCYCIDEMEMFGTGVDRLAIRTRHAASPHVVAAGTRRCHHRPYRQQPPPCTSSDAARDRAPFSATHPELLPGVLLRGTQCCSCSCDDQQATTRLMPTPSSDFATSASFKTHRTAASATGSRWINCIMDE